MAFAPQRRLINNAVGHALLTLRTAAITNLINQGHRDTGELIRSLLIEVRSEKGGEEIVGELSLFLRGVFLDRGVEAKNVKIGRVAIEKVKQWAKRKGIVSDDKKALRFVFAWRRKAMTKNFTTEKGRVLGFPTGSSRKYSKTGKRTGWFSDEVERLEAELVEMIGVAGLDAIDLRLNDILTEEAKKFEQQQF